MLNVPAVAAGTYRFGAIADDPNAIAESDETNNVLAAGNTTYIGSANLPSTQPDLIVTAMSAPASAQIGGTVFVDATVTNQGSGPARASVLMFYFSEQGASSGSFATEFCDTPPLASGETYRCNIAISIPAVAPGIYRFGAVADRFGANTEPDTANNILNAATTTLLHTGSAPDSPPPTGSTSQDGAVLQQFASRATVTQGNTVYGAFVLADPTNLYIAVRGPSLGTLGVTANPLSRPILRLYNQAGAQITESNDCSGSTTDTAAVVTYYRDTRGAALSANDACLGYATNKLSAGVYTFQIASDPSAPSGSGEVLFETTPVHN